MEEKLSIIKNFFKTNSLSAKPNSEYGTDPQIGFKVFFNETNKQLKVKVIGARQLPTNYGNTKPLGYLAKIRVFPEREKYETTTVTESWPAFNEEFVFTLHSTTSKRNEDMLKGKFISFTVYALLESEDSPKASQSGGLLKRFLSFSEFGSSREAPVRSGTSRNRRSHRHSLNSRRTVGAATYNLENSAFTQRIGDNCICTPDIWRGVKEITSGIPIDPREGKKGTVEVTLSYAVSEDGTNDVVEISVTKLRCSLQTMQEHEKLGGQLYIKITAFEYEDLIQKMKSDKFEPTISLKLEAKTATLRATVNKYNIEQVKILIRLICKNILGKKVLLGKIEISSKSDIWKEIVSSPSQPITRMMHFE